MREEKLNSCITKVTAAFKIYVAFNSITILQSSRKLLLNLCHIGYSFSTTKSNKQLVIKLKTTKMYGKENIVLQ